MKKILAIVLCLAMLFAFAACSEETPAETTADTTAADDHEHDTTAAPENIEAPDASETPDASEEEPTAEAHDHTHINYKGREAYFDQNDLAEIEGREWDFVYEQGEYNIYIYNGLTVDEMEFTQAQFTFNGTTARISCTFSTAVGNEEDPLSDEEVKTVTESKLAEYKKALTAIYGEGSTGEQHGSSYTSWSDHTGNYIILTRINETTVQVAYYIGAAEAAE